MSEHFKLQRVNGEIGDLTKQVDAVAQRIAAKEQNIKTQADQLLKLSAIIAGTVAPTAHICTGIDAHT